jgi:hypothetical protein
MSYNNEEIKEVVVWIYIYREVAGSSKKRETTIQTPPP